MEQLLAKTLAPTASPTPLSTSTTDTTVVETEVEVQVQVVKADVPFPGVTASQARTPVMRGVLETAFKAAIGFTDSKASVILTHVDGVAVEDRRRGRRLVDADPVLSFEVEANVAASDSSSADKLKANIVQAVTGSDIGGSSSGGNLVAFVKVQAAKAGVLTPELKATADDVKIAPVLTTTTKTKTVVVYTHKKKRDATLDVQNSVAGVGVALFPGTFMFVLTAVLSWNEAF